MINTKFKRYFVSMLAITIVLITLISPLNIAHAATSSDGKYNYTILGDGTIRIDRYLGSEINVTIPEYIEGKKVTIVGEDFVSSSEKGAFEGKSLKSVVIPDSVTDIGEQAFRDNQLTSVKLPKNLEILRKGSFYGNSIQDLVIPNKVTLIGDYSFYKNKLNNVTIPNSVTSIGVEAFAYNNLTSVIIPDSVTRLNLDSFIVNNIAKFIVNNFTVMYSSGVLNGNGSTSTTEVNIYGYTGSTSQTYANNNNHTFVDLNGSLKDAIVAVEQAETTKSDTDIATAQKLVNQLEDGNEKTVLQNLIGMTNLSIEDQEIKDATVAVEQAESSLKSNDIIIAQGLINVLEDSTEKTNLQNRLDAVQKEVNKKQAETDATNAVEKAESTHNQTDLDNAKTLVNALPSGTVKDNLQNRLDTVQTIIGDDKDKQPDQQAETDATNAVEQAESTHNQTDLDKAKDLVNALPSGSVKDNLLGRIDAVQDTIDNGKNNSNTGTAVTNDVNFILEGGELSLTNSDVVSFGKIKLGAQPESHSTSFTNHFTVKDLTGNQAGYRVDVSATTFTDGKNTLPKGTLSLKPVVSIERVGNGTSIAPVSSMNANQIIDNGKVTLISAAEGTGMGVFNLTFPNDALSITVDPTTAKIDGASSTYQSTVTWDLIQAP